MIDLRSDTVTKPTPGMIAAMMSAAVGDDVYGEDPTVNELQDRVARLTGKEAALFVPSGTMGNQLCLRTHTQPGDEVICDYSAHIFNYESGAAGNLSQVQLHPLRGRHGILTTDLVASAIRDRAYWNPWTRLIALENTVNKAGGTIYPIETMKEIFAYSRQVGIQVHLDGARLWNAHVATGVPVHDYTALVDSVSLCFSKGLGAPVGSVIAGTKEFITKAHRLRKMWGGGMRQAGILAAACIYALDHHLKDLKKDHDRIRRLAGSWSEVAGVEIDPETVRTNILIVDVGSTRWSAPEWVQLLKENGVLSSPFSNRHVRMVTHRDLAESDIDRACEIIQTVKG